MKNKGFSLIELLAVIVILSIIAIIATPIILGIIKDSTEESNKRSIEMYAKVIQNANALKQLDGSLGIAGKFKTSTLEDKLKVEYDGNVACDIIEIYADGTMYLDKCKVNKMEVEYSYGKKASFFNDSWETITANVKAGYMYNVGDTKEIYLEDFINSELDSKGLYTVRIANNTLPEECNVEGFSQSACGFVVEFEDIINQKGINSVPTNVGGWKDSEIRKYVNDIIYNSLPKKLSKNIIETTVISGHGDINEETNFITKDKIYLLSTKELCGENDFYDTAKVETRQLDYYKTKGVTKNDYKGAIKKHNGKDFTWWLRSACSRYALNFYYVSMVNGLYDENANNIKGIAPAFRIG